MENTGNGDDGGRWWEFGDPQIQVPGARRKDRQVHREGRGRRVAARPAGEYRNAAIRPSGAGVALPPFAEV